MGRQVSTVLLVLLGGSLLLAPAAFNGFTFLFFDTRGYYNVGKGIFRLVAGMLSFSGNPGEPAMALDAVAAPGAVGRFSPDEISLVRSPFYGMFFYATDVIGPWLFAAIQTSVVAWLLWLVVARNDFGGRITYLWLMLLVAACTALPFFATYAMPDVWAGIAVISVFLLTSCFRELRPIEWIGLTVLLAFALLAHASHVLLVAALFAVVGLWDWIHSARETSRAGLALVAAALALAVLGNASLVVAAKLKFGIWPTNAPLLMARVIEDGPGRRLIAEECGERKWLVCQFADQIGGDSQAFLWSTRPENGVYSLLSAEDKRRLASEELGFVVRAVFKAPVAQLRASLANWLEQLSMFGRYEFATATMLTDLVPLYMPHRAADFAASGAARGTWPWGVLSILDYVTVSLAIVAVVLSTSRSRALAEPAVARARRLLWLVVAALAINAFVCGVISDPHHRYQARLIWLLPAAALLNVAAVRRAAA